MPKDYFKKGPDPRRNIIGAKKLSESERHAREDARLQIAEIWPAITAMKIGDLMERRKDPNLTVLQAWFLAAAVAGIKNGDLTNLMKMYERLLGKPAALIDVRASPEVLIMGLELSDV